MTRRIHAACLLPICAPPIRGGWLDIESDRIVAIGEATSCPSAGGAPPEGAAMAGIDLGHVVVLPGLVNAHTHLELSHLRGLVPPMPSLIAWVTKMLAERAAADPPDAAVIRRAIDEAVATGTAGIADVGNGLASADVLVQAPVESWHFDERLGFRAGQGAQTGTSAWRDAATRTTGYAATRTRFGVAPHAPYSTAPDLMRAIVAGLDEDPARRSTLHVAESPEESQLLADGTGPWRDLLERFGVWEPAWTPPGTSTVRYLERLGALHPRLLIVHGTHCSRADLDILAAAGCTLVLCARSNAWVGVGAPPVAEASASGVRIAIGTDSLASVDDLNLFAELAALARLAPDVAAEDLLRAATLDGADALGFARLGRLAPGASTRALVIDLPASTHDPQSAVAWLVRDGAVDARVRWLDECLEHQDAA